MGRLRAFWLRITRARLRDDAGKLVVLHRYYWVNPFSKRASDLRARFEESRQRLGDGVMKEQVKELLPAGVFCMVIPLLIAAAIFCFAPGMIKQSPMITKLSISYPSVPSIVAVSCGLIWPISQVVGFALLRRAVATTYAKAFLRARFCASCMYDLTDVPGVPDAPPTAGENPTRAGLLPCPKPGAVHAQLADALTTCPECGAVWRLLKSETPGTPPG